MNANEQAQDLRDELEVKQHTIPKYLEEVITDYKVFIMFKGV